MFHRILIYLDKLKNGLLLFLQFMEKAHYHVYPVRNVEGHIIGHEIITTRGGVMTFHHCYCNNSKKDDG